MKTKNNLILIITSLLCLLPLILSFTVYADLPDQIAVHWGADGNPDNVLPKAAAAFGLPILFFIINLISKMRLYNDPKSANASEIMRTMITWLIPFLSLFAVPIVLFMAMGVSIPISVIIPILIGIVFTVFGNYLPKSKQNYTIGIKLPWTLHNADNWNKTNRIAGYSYIVGGFALIALAFISFESAVWSVITISILILLIAFPFLYSYLIYKKDSGKEETNSMNND